MRVFNKYAALNKLDNKNNNKTKKRAIIVCVVVLIIGILYFSFARFESTQSFSLINGVGYIKPTPIKYKMISLAANGATDLEYDGVDTLGELGTSDNNLRYVGANPNNYIYFNCSTAEPAQMNDTTCEKWRIVGLMNNVEDESGNSTSRVKITREPFDTKYTFDSSDSSVNSGRGINQWGESTYQDGTPYEGSDIMRELNTDYLGITTIGTDGKWYNGRNNEKTASMPERLLSSSAKDMVETVVWKVGSISIENGSYDSSWNQCSSLKVYNRERTESNWTLYNFDNINRTTRWTGKISLIYASDYDYATSGGNAMNKNTCLNASSKKWLTMSDENYKDCFNNDWLRSSKSYYTLNMLDTYEGSHTVFALVSQGYSNVAYSYETNNIRPSLYLKSNVAITSGNGTESNPYKLAQIPNLTDTMKALASANGSDLEYDGTTTLGENGTPDNNLRYVGSTPNNYIYFNCSTTNISEMNDSTCEKWRIIGLMNNIEDENGNIASRVKIMRDESLGYYSWDTSDNSINNGNGINQWGPSGTYEGADLMRELNTDYLGNVTVGTNGSWYNQSNNGVITIPGYPSMPQNTLNENTQNMIATVKWDTGSNVAADGPDWLPKTMYEYERSSNVGKDCPSSTYCNDTVNRTTSWVGKIALIYPSDYFYATSGGSTLNKSACLNTMLSEWNNNSSIDGISDCYANSWVKPNSIFQWTLSPEADYVMSSMVYSIGVNGLEGSVTADSPLLVRPSVYLESGIVIAGGNGSSANPYKLILE